MVEIDLSYITDLPSHFTTVIVNGEEICHDNTAQEMNFTTQAQDGTITVKMLNRLRDIPPVTTKNPFKIVAGVVAMIFLPVMSDADDLEFDCRDYETEFLFTPSQIHVSIALYARNSMSNGKARIYAHTDGCDVTAVDKKATVNEKHTREQFDEYRHFNLLRTIILATLFIGIAIIALVKHSLYTFILACVFFVGITVLFFVLKRRISKTEKKYLSN